MSEKYQRILIVLGISLGAVGAFLRATTAEQHRMFGINGTVLVLIAVSFAFVHSVRWVWRRVRRNQYEGLVG